MEEKRSKVAEGVYKDYNKEPQRLGQIRRAMRA